MTLRLNRWATFMSASAGCGAAEQHPHHRLQLCLWRVQDHVSAHSLAPSQLLITHVHDG